jgi:ankyrin repeat protein
MEDDDYEDVYAKNEAGRTALHDAVLRGNVAAAQALCQPTTSKKEQGSPAARQTETEPLPPVLANVKLGSVSHVQCPEPY